MKTKNSKLSINIKKIIGVSLAILSLGSSVAVCGGDEDGLDKNKGHKYPSIYLPVEIDNSRDEDLHKEMENLKELDKENLIRIFDKDFVPILLRDMKIVQDECNINETRRNLEAYFFHNIDFPTKNYFLSILWSGSFRIILDKGIAGIETMRNDFRNWMFQKITIESLIRYFLTKFEH